MSRKPRHHFLSYLVIGLVLLMPVLAFGQLIAISRAAASSGTKTWTKVYGQEMDETIYDLAATPDGGYLLVGNTNLFKNRIGTGLIVKIESQGKLVSVTAPWSAGGYWDEIRGIKPIVGGGFLAVGIRNPQAFPAEKQGWLLRLDLEGKILWEKMLKGAWPSEFHDVAVMRDGGGIAIGSTAGGFRAASGVIAVRFDPDGTILWQNVYDETGCPSNGCTLVATSDGGALLTGVEMSTTSAERGNSDVWVGRVDSSGALTWQSTFGGDLGDELYAGLEYVDGSFLLGGMMQAPGLTSRPWLMRINAGGQLVWGKQYPWGPYGSVFALAAGVGDHAIAGGMANMSAFTVFEIDGSGQLIWVRGYDRFQSDNQVRGLVVRSSEIVAGGWTNSQASSTSWDLMVMKLDRKGQIKNSPKELKVWAKPRMKAIKAPLTMGEARAEAIETEWEVVSVTTPLYPFTLTEIKP